MKPNPAWSTPLPTPAAIDPPTALAGIDLRIGRASTAGNERLLCRLLLMFCAGQHDVVERFRAARACGDDASALRLAHTLRSVATTLGMTALASHARRLERACLDLADDGNELQLLVLLDDVDQALAPVLQGLKAWQDQAAGPG